MVSKEYVKGDLPEKAAILQRDGETYAIAPHIPGGIVFPETLRRMADIAEKYEVAALKITSAQRIAIVGLKEEDLDAAWEDLGLKPGAAIGLCVRSIKICPGTTFCKRGKQDSVGLGLKLDEKYHGMQLPSKFKMGVCGCPNSCSEPRIKDIGIMGTPKGFTVSVGGSAGLRPRLGDIVVKDLSEEQVLDLVERIISFYKGYEKPRRIGEVIDEIGIEEFKTKVGLSQ
jgi:NAD(P)H-nitrite reductase large subunit